MVLLLPIAILLATAGSFMAFYINANYPLRRSLLSMALGLFLFIALSTEFLSFFDAINKAGITVSWVFLNLALAAWCFSLQRKNEVRFADLPQLWAGRFTAFRKSLGSLTQVVLFSVLIITLLVAIVAKPNNIDSLCYHLSRLGYWLQNGDVEHYASHIERAISFAPLSEYVHLHTFVLSGGDRYFQLLQWLSFTGILFFVSMLVALFGGSSSAMKIALCFAVTVPIGVLEAMTTQNDLVVSFFIIAAVYYIFSFLKYGLKADLFFLTIAVAMGIMTKGTFVFYTLPFALYFLVVLLKRGYWKVLITTGVMVVLLTFISNSPFWYRTYKVFQSPIGTMSSGNQNDNSDHRVFASSVSKHVFLHLGFVSPGDRYNGYLQQVLTDFHDRLGIPLDSPSAGMPFKMNKLNFNEDFAHNFLAMWLILFGMLALPFGVMNFQSKLYWSLAFFAFLFFCYFIGYQVYGSRIHLPFFMLMAPAIGLLYSMLNGIIQKVLILTLWLNALPFALLSATHPLLSTRWFFEEVFPVINKPLGLNIEPDKLSNLKQKSILESTPGEIVWGESWPEIQEMVALIDAVDAKNIGFDFEEYSHDYAYQYAIKKEGRRFGHVMVRNPSSSLEDKEFRPDCIVSEHQHADIVVYRGVTYQRKWSGRGRSLYIPN